VTVTHQQVYDGLANMISAGINIKQALHISVTKSSGALRNAVLTVASAIGRGSTLAAAMSAHPKVFPRLDAALIEVAEMSGRLPEAFRALAKWYRLKTSIWYNLRSELAYPFIVVHAAAFIFPVPMLFKGQTLAEYFSTVFSTLLYFYLPISAIFVFFKLAKGNSPFRRVIDSLLLTIPLLGKALHNIAFGRYCFGFLILYQCGVSMEKTAKFAADLTGNAAISAMLAGGARSARRGMPVSKGFSSRVPKDFKALWKTGETTGRLEETLQKIYEDRVEVGQLYLKRFARWLPRVVYTIVFFAIIYPTLRRASTLFNYPF
jgi:type II secretory pathway component PulF